MLLSALPLYILWKERFPVIVHPLQPLVGSKGQRQILKVIPRQDQDVERSLSWELMGFVLGRCAIRPGNAPVLV
jgi:hypothetical protein